MIFTRSAKVPIELNQIAERIIARDRSVFESFMPEVCPRFASTKATVIIASRDLVTVEFNSICSPQLYVQLPWPAVKGKCFDYVPYASLNTAQGGSFSASSGLWIECLRHGTNLSILERVAWGICQVFRDDPCNRGATCLGFLQPIHW